MKENDTYKVNIYDEDNIGNGICKVNDFVVFVKGALKDETLEIIIKEVKKRYATATIKRIIFPSNYRVIPKCKHYNSCGGCAFLHTTYDNERKIKQKYIEKLFNKKINYIKNKNELNYRNKVTFHVKDNKLGFYNENTHELCEINNCLLLHPLMNNKISEIKRFDLSCISEIMMRVINNKLMISVTSSKDDINIKNINCDSLYINNKHIKGEEYLIDEINGFKFSIYPDSFYQVNKEGMTNIYNIARDYIEDCDSLLDLYCGTGTIALWVHDKAKKVTAIEINKTAIKNANINKELNNIDNVEFICNDAKNVKGQYDTIIIDPPRNGMSVYVVDYLNYSKAKNIVYISCNPNTLKRDLSNLDRYELKELSACDMFPKTKHVECIALLERK